ncbi:MAG: type II toxin-antitoxin system VapC family toxin [Methanobacteriaceae archaeon]
MIFLETSFLIGLYVKKDKHHKQAIEIAKEIREEKKIINKMVIYEVLTVLRKKNVKTEDIKKYYNNLISLVVLDDTQYHQKALEYCLNNQVGFFDNLHYIHMKNKGINKIASFDKYFDIFEDINRIH